MARVPVLSDVADVGASGQDRRQLELAPANFLREKLIKIPPASVTRGNDGL